MSGYTQQDRDLIANYISKHKVTLCAPALASGAETTKITRRDIAARRRAHAMWQEEQKLRKAMLG